MNTIEPNEADLDVVNIECECDNTFDMPRDALFAIDDLYCGKCCEQGKMSVKEVNQPHQ